MSTTLLSDAYPASLAVMSDDERTAFLTAHPEISIGGYSGLARHRSDMLLRAGDLNGAVAILRADSDARFLADFERRCAAGKPSLTGRIMSGAYAAFRVYFVGLVASGAAILFGAHGLAAAIHGVAIVGMGIAGIIGALTAPKGA